MSTLQGNVCVKTDKLKRRMQYLFGALIVLYPVLVFSALVILKLSIKYLSIFIIALAAAYFLVNRHHYKGRHRFVVFISPAILCGIGIICLITKSSLTLKIYPALADLVYLVIMWTSIFIPPPVVFYFINMFDKTIKEHIAPRFFDRYCRKAAIVWCVFFVFDGAVSLFTVFLASDVVWGVYNGGITYVLMGLIFVGEYFILKMIEKKSLAGKLKPGEQEGTDVHR
ncbi:MAG: hypothetical protein LBQ67_01145 [Treponema sp.]|jgi:uncharacterized membrane protein|nr:hypothetical protein [Treponema sp.]